MTRLFIVVTGIAVLSFAQTVFAGPGASGGGQGIVCRNEDGSVASARLLDLVEAQDYFLLPVESPPTDQGYLEIALNVAKALDGAIPYANPVGAETETMPGQAPTITGYEISAMVLPYPGSNSRTLIGDLVSQIDSTKMLIPGNDFEIPPVGDSHPLVLPTQKNCAIEQIALYSDGSDQVHFVGAVWNQLDNVNKAALLLHESLYRTMRTMGDTTSDQTRKAVGYLFGGFQFDSVIDGLGQQKYLNCWTTDPGASYQFVVFPTPGQDPAQDMTVLFLVYNGEVMLTQTSTHIPLASFAKTFGITTQETYGFVWGATLSNPLLDFPKYQYAMTVDPNAGTTSYALAVETSASGSASLPVQCNDHLSQITYLPGGGVSVGPVYQ